MKELQITFPTTLTDEEKHLKEMQEKFKLFRRLMNERKGGGESKTDKRTIKRTVEEATAATEELKRKIQSGVITVKKRDEKSTFKRAKFLEKRSIDRTRTVSGSFEGEDGEIVETPTSSGYDNTRFNVESTSDTRTEGDNRGPTIYIRGYDLRHDSVRNAFDKFGIITRINIDERQNSRTAFVQYETEREADRALQEMDGSMLNGMTIRVSFARRQNNTRERERNSREYAQFTPRPSRQREERYSCSSSSSMDISAEMDTKNAADITDDVGKETRSMVTYNDSDVFNQ